MKDKNVSLERKVYCMINLIEEFVKVRRHIILDERDVMTMLRVLDDLSIEPKHIIRMNMEIGNCGWENRPKCWYIFFDLSDKYWKTLISILKKLDYGLVLDEDANLYLAKRVES